MGPIDLPAELMQPVYDALANLFELSCDPKYHVHHLLMDGKALVFDHARVLHARTGFNGNRHLRLTHIGSDEVYSRWRQLQARLEDVINPISSSDIVGRGIRPPVIQFIASVNACHNGAFTF